MGRGIDNERRRGRACGLGVAMTEAAPVMRVKIVICVEMETETSLAVLQERIAKASDEISPIAVGVFLTFMVGILGRYVDRSIDISVREIGTTAISLDVEKRRL